MGIFDIDDNEYTENLNKQTVEESVCILENIGTENKCILESTFYTNLKEIETMYDDMVKTYLSIFYNERYNCILGDLGKGKLLYDPYQTAFVNRHNLFNRKNNLKTVHLSDQITDSMFEIKY